MAYWHLIKNICMVIESYGWNYFHTIISILNSQWQTRKEAIAYIYVTGTKTGSEMKRQDFVFSVNMVNWHGCQWVCR